MKFPKTDLKKKSSFLWFLGKNKGPVHLSHQPSVKLYNLQKLGRGPTILLLNSLNGRWAEFKWCSLNKVCIKEGKLIPCVCAHAHIPGRVKLMCLVCTENSRPNLSHPWTLTLLPEGLIEIGSWGERQKIAVGVQGAPCPIHQHLLLDTGSECSLL